MKKKHLFAILITAFLINNLFATDLNFARISSVQNSPNTKTISFEIDSLIITKTSKNSKNYSNISFSNLTSCGIQDKPDIPIYTLSINASENNIAATIKIIEEKTVTLENPIAIFNDVAKGADFTTEAKEKEISTFPSKILSTEYNGLFQDSPVSSVYFYPIQVLDKNTLRIVEKAEISITTNTSDLSFSTKGNNKKYLFGTEKVGSVQQAFAKKSNYDSKTGKPFINIKISEDGIYRINYKMLKKLDINLKQIDPNSFSLFNKGGNTPIYISGEKDGEFNKNDYIEFIGKRNPNSTDNTSEFDPFSDVNVYQLYWDMDNGLRFSEESAEPSYSGSDLITPVEYDYEYCYEKNESFQRLGYVYTDILSTENDQYFFSTKIYSGSSEEFEFDLPSPNQNTTKNVYITARLQSISQETDHTAHLLINGQNIGQSTWNWDEPGYIEQNSEFYLPNNFLNQGTNTITINLEYNSDDQTSAILLDWVKIHYYRDFTAEDNYIEFNKPTDQINGYYQYNIENFTSNDISVYKNDQSKLTKFQKSFDSETQTYSIRLQDVVNSDTYYLAVAGESISEPDTCYLDTLNNILNINGCDHLCIVADQFFDKSKELEDFYAEQNIDCYRVKLSDIYNQFNDGIMSPYAIKNFLKKAHSTWDNFPKWLLLIGDANLDDEEKNLLPTVMFQTYQWGGSASDYWYSLIVGDDNIPDIAVGRWACGNEAELETLLEKRINYTNEQPVDAWRQTYLFIAGKEDFFKEQTDYFTENVIQAPATISRILINPSNVSSRFYGGTDTLVSRVNRGVKILNFVGHGGGAIWADRSLLRLQDIYKFNNSDKLSFFSSLTCFTADFAAHQSLGEAITELYGGGAIGLFGSSGVGWVKNDFILGVPMHKYLQKNISIGEAINLAKIEYITKNNAFSYLKNSMIYQYNLLGDPGVTLAKVDDNDCDLTISNTEVQPNSNINFSGELPFDSGELKVQIYDNNKYPITSVIPYSFTAKDFSESIFFPDSTIESGFLNIYGSNTDKTQDFAKALYFSAEETSISDITFTPEEIRYGDEITLTVDLISDVDSVYWEIDTTNVSTYVNDIGLIVVSAFSNSDNGVEQIKCVETTQNHYQSTTHFTPTDPAKYYAYRIAWYVDGEKFTNSAATFDIQEMYDISITSVSQGGITAPSLEVCATLSQEDTVEATIKLYASNNYDYKNSEVLYTKQQSLYPQQDNIVYLPVLMGKDSLSGTVEITSSQTEKNEYNNYIKFDLPVNTFLVSPQLGSSLSGSQNDTIFFGNRFYIHFSPYTFNDSCVISIEEELLEDISQPDFLLFSADDTSSYGYNLELSGENVFAKEATIGFKNISNSSKYNIINYDKTLQLWMSNATETVSNSISAKVTKLGKYSIAEIKDTEAPDMEINFDGKQIEEQSYVNLYPMISLIFNDDNGINLSEEGLNIWLDDEQIAFSELNIADTLINTKNVNCNYRTELESGTHYLKVEIADAAANTTEEEVEFTIYKNLKILDYGNYPNPFQTRTWFVYETTKDVDEFKIKIYSSSGRKIRTIDDSNVFTDKDLTESGYHEVSWDGKDDYGDNIANGVYFYKMIAKTSSKTVTTKGVIAKVK